MLVDGLLCRCLALQASTDVVVGIVDVISVAVFNGCLVSYVVSCCRYKSLSLSEALYGNVAVHIIISCSIWSLQLGSVASGCPSVITRYTF